MNFGNAAPLLAVSRKILPTAASTSRPKVDFVSVSDLDSCRVRTAHQSLKVLTITHDREVDSNRLEYR